MRTKGKSRRAAATFLALSAGLASIAVPSLANASPAQDCQPAEPDEGYRMLFDGTPDSLANWSQAGPGEFTHQPDCTILSTGGLGLLWHSSQSMSRPDELQLRHRIAASDGGCPGFFRSSGRLGEFNAYRLRLDWKLAGDDNSGVFVGFPDPGDDPWVAADHGYEVQIDATDTPDKTTGAIYGFQTPDIPARDEALNPPGEWNSYEIVVRGQSLDVYLNDVLINQFVNTDPERDLTQGFVGLQNHGEGDDIWFREVQIRELDDRTR